MRRNTIYNGIWASGRRLAFLLPLALLGACSQDEMAGNGLARPDEEIPLLVRAITLEDGAVTRSASSPAAGSSIGVFRQADSYYTTASNNIKYTLTADKGWQPATAGTDILLGANDSRALLYAYHPNAGKIAVAADNVSVPLAARAYDADYDLSYMAAGQAVALDVAGLVYNFHPGVTFAMKHAYTQLAVALTRGADYGGVGAVTAVSLAVNGGGKLYSGGTQNIATGAYTAGTADINKITYTVPAGTKVTPANKTATFAQLLPPGKDGTISNLTLTVTVDGVTTNTTVSAAGLDLTAGHRYLVKATLNYNGLAVTIQTTDWDSQTAWKEDVSFVPIIPPIDIGLPFVIASGNLIATKQADGAYKYAFAEWQGYYSGELTKGDYFARNMLEPGKAQVIGWDWDDALDPCRQVAGGEWRTATKNQWQTMIDKGSVWGTYTKGGTTVNGYYLGTSSLSSAQATQDDYVFLPAAGYRWDSDAVSCSSVGVIGAYQYGQASDQILYFSNGGISPGDMNSGYIGSVRCVKDKPKEPIDIGLDFLIAPGNVVATSTGYKFADDQGYYSGVTDAAYDPSGGDYFAWNTLDPAATSSTNTTNVWDPNSDPCRQIGDGQWQTPTQAQLQKLADLYTNKQAIWGTYKMKDDSGPKEGWYFGTTTVPDEANQDKYVFLPVAGYRYGSSYSNAGTNGSYWSGTLDTSDTNYAYYLYFYSGNCYVYDGYRNHGFSVRCVRNK